MDPDQLVKPKQNKFNRFKSSSKIFLLTVPRRYFFWGSFVFFVSCVSHAFASVHCCLVVTCLERADLLAFLVMSIVFFVTFQCGILGQVWYFIVLFPDLCCLSYFIMVKVNTEKSMDKINVNSTFWIYCFTCEPILRDISPSSKAEVVSTCGGIPGNED